MPNLDIQTIYKLTLHGGNKVTINDLGAKGFTLQLTIRGNYNSDDRELTVSLSDEEAEQIAKLLLKHGQPEKTLFFVPSE